MSAQASEVQGLRAVGALIANDSFAGSFQSLGQYRRALLQAVECQLAAPGWSAKPRCWACGMDGLDLHVADGVPHCEACGPRP